MIKQADKEDLTGKNRLVVNTLVSWTSHLVLIVSGFIMPRLVDGFVGQEQLGVWDFCWSFISYLVLVGLGVGSDSNRFIAEARSNQDYDRLNQVLSTVIAIQLVVSFVTFLGTLAVVFSFDIIFSDRLGDYLSESKGVMLFLGLSLVATNLFSSFRGVLTGYHRWDIHNGLTALTSLISLAGMLFALVNGFGIVGMACAYFIVSALLELLRLYLTCKYCEKLAPRWKLISFNTAKEVMGYGVKCKLASLAPVFLLQSINILIVSALGPAMLAVFSRSFALTKHISTFLSKFTMIITPSVSSMLNGNNSDELRSFFILTTKLNFAFALPLVIFLVIFGDVVLTFWMGSNYANASLITILAIGALLPIAQDPSLRILMGLNQHGKISFYLFLLVFVLYGLFYIYFQNTPLTLVSAALALTIPMNIAYGLLLPISACQKIALSKLVYIKQAILPSFLAILPFICLVIFARYLFNVEQYILSLLLLMFSGIVLLFVYANFILTKVQRNKFINKIHKR
ncbi:MAG: oligosaccharide flippase family protein [Psychromonas sp.]|nr:oligosaccharide flippase family protein [Alteromonadales bacterium]MCP5078219.1 oligosaccharide flippase family protein [Psychromonas sp.]